MAGTQRDETKSCVAQLQELLTGKPRRNEPKRHEHQTSESDLRVLQAFVVKISGAG
jgi:hypothetical protein